MLQKDQKLGIITFVLFFALLTDISLWVVYDTPIFTSLLMGPIFALFIGFLIWTYLANEERRKQIEIQQKIIDSEDDRE